MGRLEEILQIVSANSEESIDDVLTLLSPDALPKEEIQETFEEVLGYDPTTYYDIKDIHDRIDKIMDADIPKEVSDFLASDKQLVAQESFDVFEENKPKYFDESISQVILDKTGHDIMEDTDLEDDDDDDDIVEDDLDDEHDYDD